MRYSKILLIPGEGWATKPMNGMDHAETMTYLYLIKQGYKAMKLNPSKKLTQEQKLELAEINIPTSIIRPVFLISCVGKERKLLLWKLKEERLGCQKPRETG